MIPMALKRGADHAYGHVPCGGPFGWMPKRTHLPCEIVRQTHVDVVSDSSFASYAPIKMEPDREFL